MEEIWKDVAGYEGLYQVSNMGRVKTLRKKVGTTIRKEKILKQYNENGYLNVRLYKEKYKGVHCRVHRLVASAFCENDDAVSKIEVNHKNENAFDNRADNLEWCTPIYNKTYGTRLCRIALANQKHVACFDREGKFIKEFPSLYDAGKWACGKEVGFSNISACARGKTSTAYGYRWRFVEKEVMPNEVC